MSLVPGRKKLLDTGMQLLGMTQFMHYLTSQLSEHPWRIIEANRSCFLFYPPDTLVTVSVSNFINKSRGLIFTSCVALGKSLNLLCLRFFIYKTGMIIFICFIGLVWGLHELTQIEHFEQSLVSCYNHRYLHHYHLVLFTLLYIVHQNTLGSPHTQMESQRVIRLQRTAASFVLFFFNLHSWSTSCVNHYAKFFFYY